MIWSRSARPGGSDQRGGRLAGCLHGWLTSESPQSRQQADGCVATFLIVYNTKTKNPIKSKYPRLSDIQASGFGFDIDANGRLRFYVKNPCNTEISWFSISQVKVRDENSGANKNQLNHLS
ncbi:hypothetical protein [Burkholderia glumae]|uniref:hypothetical protein n=1 Tax=Burkholderia glumae TaxID=337 RepID=UPI0020D011BD|nr:hypothetical protein [Burkholderia glumae]